MVVACTESLKLEIRLQTDLQLTDANVQATIGAQIRDEGPTQRLTRASVRPAAVDRDGSSSLAAGLDTSAERLSRLSEEDRGQSHCTSHGLSRWALHYRRSSPGEHT